ncbi:MAG: hypothetical protein KatS3mg087_1611 [Patescibacteria group bacterium]|nr:MAG: hypothetical protein KatS3mg087_1611 [Patescibacteria group bacterium]
MRFVELQRRTRKDYGEFKQKIFRIWYDVIGTGWRNLLEISLDLTRIYYFGATI